MRRVRRILIAVPAILFGCAAYVYLTIPDVRPLRTTNPPSTAFMELRAREARAHGEKPRRVQKWISYARISPQLVRAVLVTEDSRFWRHAGLDYEQIKESMEVNLERGEFARGASTITQQLAKNLYLSPSKNPIRKLRELIIARRLESELTKQRILELYLNVIEWGDGVYGAEAAARTYFRTPASELDAAESALLAAAIANPRIMNPAQPTARLRRRQQMVMRRMGAVEPPAATAADAEETLDAPDIEQVPPLPPPITFPGALPGQPVAPPKPPVKPGGGGTAQDGR
ncbi:MAG TPA: monofunctional biosynthetic peptidoglycan transglycosylase [Vicinamibacterales bacterium]|jgi:monofunctional biosynthetic peptidoglycan transglycosylase|nr:monofunctional biosynthetic peptidoglycan transglycosylase [Vicinamibacterales bacterium]